MVAAHGKVEASGSQPSMMIELAWPLSTSVYASWLKYASYWPAAPAARVAPVVGTIGTPQIIRKPDPLQRCTNQIGSAIVCQLEPSR